jgi:hypothetical protein
MFVVVHAGRGDIAVWGAAEIPDRGVSSRSEQPVDMRDRQTERAEGGCKRPLATGANKPDHWRAVSAADSWSTDDVAHAGCRVVVPPGLGW